MRIKYIIAVVSVLLVLVCVSVVYGFASSANSGSTLGSIFKKYKVDKKFNSDKIIVKFNDFTITQDTVDYYKEYYNSYGIIKSQDEIISKIVADTLILKEAEKAGVSVKDEVVRENMNKIRENLPKDNTGYEEYLAFIEKSGWTEDEYWENSFSVYKKAYIIGKYRNNILKEKYREENKALSDADLESKFKEYYEKKIEDLVKSVDIVYLD